MHIRDFAFDDCVPRSDSHIGDRIVRHADRFREMGSASTLTASMPVVRQREQGQNFSRAIKGCRQKFLRIFPGGFRDETYLEWERNYKWEAHREWEDQLGKPRFLALLRRNEFREIAARAVRIESGRSLLFSFEKMALRDAVRGTHGAKAFAQGLYDFLYGEEDLVERFDRWCGVVGSLPRKQTRVLTWPLVTVFGFIAQPAIHVFLKPNTTKIAAQKCALAFHYVTRPNGTTYAEYVALAHTVRGAIRDMRPRDMIDIQSFLWVQGSDEYA